MNVIVFGATGRVGSCLVEQAIDAGHHVTAFVRDGRRLKAGGDRVSVVEGDALDLSAVRSALRPGFDAVLVALGATALKPSRIMTDGMRAILRGMKETGTERLLGVSGTAEMPNMTLPGRWCTAVMKLTPIGHAVRDHDGAMEEIRLSGLRWTLAGCPYIKEGPRRGGYQTALIFPGGWKIIHPPDVANFLIRELTEEKFVGEIVGLWY